MPSSPFPLNLDLPSTRRYAKPLAALLLAACTAIVWYNLEGSDSEPVAATPPPPQPTASRNVEISPVALPPSAQLAESKPAAAAKKALTVDAVAKLIKDATDGDADTRADAIFALASAPPAQAVPALHGIIVSGDIVNGHLALDALRTMALSQGDSDGSIVRSVRFAVYHGTSDTITQSAQEILDELATPAEAVAP